MEKKTYYTSYYWAIINKIYLTDAILYKRISAFSRSASSGSLMGDYHKFIICQINEL